MNADVSLPSSIIKRISSGYSVGLTVNEIGLHACALQAKPTQEGSYADRILPTFTIVYVLRGAGTHVDHLRQRHRVKAGDLIQHLPHLPHTVTQDPDGQWLECWLTISATLAQMLASLGAIDMTRTLLHPGVLINVVEQILEILDTLSRADHFAPQTATAMVHHVLIQLLAADTAVISENPTLQMITRASQILSGQLDQRLDIPAMTRDFPISYERFRKIFRAHTGLAPAEYRIHKRIQHARVLLEQHQLSVKQAARALGYKDPFIFSKQFKRITGMSPSVILKVRRQGGVYP